jgi:hypothetical protein
LCRWTEENHVKSSGYLVSLPRFEKYYSLECDVVMCYSTEPPSGFVHALSRKLGFPREKAYNVFIQRRPYLAHITSLLGYNKINLSFLVSLVFLQWVACILTDAGKHGSSGILGWKKNNEK